MVLADGLSPAITRWAENEERKIMKHGVPLEPVLLDLARSLGIRRPEEVRVWLVARIPLPVPASLVRCASRWGLPVFAPGGMALGRGIYLIHGQEASLRHELVHTAQYERLGGILPFMRRYVFECLAKGYAGADLEVEAREKSG